MNVNKAVEQICCDHLTPFYYLGMTDKTVNKGNTFWRNFFAPESTDIVHDKRKMLWHEMRETHGIVLPTAVCPCEEGDYVSSYDSYIERYLTHAHLWQGATVDCDFEQFLRPGENPYASGRFREQVEDYFAGLKMKVDESFDWQEEIWIAQLLTKGSFTVSPKGGKPFDVEFKRKKELEHTIEAPERQWCQDPGKGGEYKHTPWKDIEYMDHLLWKCNKGRTDTIIMNWQTCQWMRNAFIGQAKDCKDAGTYRLLLPGMEGFASVLPQQRFDGARVFGVLAGEVNITIYCVESETVYCDSVTGEDVCINMLKDGKVYGYNRAGTNRNTLDVTMAYGRIDNYFMDTDIAKRFFHQYTVESGMSMKYFGQSTPIAMMKCPDASWCMDVCGGKAPKEG